MLLLSLCVPYVIAAGVVPAVGECLSTCVHREFIIFSIGLFISTTLFTYWNITLKDKWIPFSVLSDAYNHSCKRRGVKHWPCSLKVSIIVNLVNVLWSYRGVSELSCSFSPQMTVLQGQHHGVFNLNNVHHFCRSYARDGDPNAKENLSLPLDGGLAYRHPVLPDQTV